jgi:hypothetical protein
MTSPGPTHLALVAHDDRKGDLLEWAKYNRDVLASHVLYATGTTGQMLGDRLDLPVTCFQSGPLGGDQQIGALIASGDLARVAGMVPGAGEAVFAVACTVGWIAHALEAYAGGGPLRPRAVFTGPPAIIDP